MNTSNDIYQHCSANSLKIIGKNLQNHRQQRNLSIEDIAKNIHLHINLVEAIESGDIQSYLSRTNIQNFDWVTLYRSLKSYAKHLNLSVEFIDIELNKSTSNNKIIRVGNLSDKDLYTFK